MTLKRAISHTAILIRSAWEGIWEGMVWSAAFFVVFVILVPGFHERFPREFPLGITFGTAIYIIGRLYLYFRYGK